MKVPVLQPQAELRPASPQYDGTRYSPEDFGAGVGKGLEQVGQTLATVAAHEKEKADDFRSAEADLQFGKAINDHLYDKEKGFLLKQGQDALDMDPTVQSLSKAQADIARGLANNSQREKFMARSSARMEQAREQMMQHSGVQHKQLYGQIADGQMQLSLDNIGLNYGDPAKVNSEIYKVLVEPDGSPGVLVRHLKDNLGLPPEKIQAEINNFKQKAYATALQGYLAKGDGAGAEKYFSQVKDNLGALGPKFQHDIESVYKDQEGERTAQSIFSNSLNKTSGWVDSAKAEAELDKLPAGPVKDEARQRLMQRLQVAANEKEKAINSVFSRALSDYQKGGGLASVAPADKAYLQSQYNDPLMWQKLEAIARGDAEHARNQPPTPEQERAMTEWRVFVADHPDKAATMTLDQFNATWLPRFATRDRESGGSILAAMHAQASQPGKLSPLEDRMLLGIGRANGLFPGKENDVSKWDDDQATLLYQTAEDLSQWMAQEKKATAKTPSPERVEQQVRIFLTRKAKPGTGFLGMFEDKVSPVEEQVQGRSEAAQSAVEQSQIDEGRQQGKFTLDDKQQAVNALKAHGVRLDDGTIDAYLRRKYGLPAAKVSAIAPKTKEEIKAEQLRSSPRGKY